MPAAQSGGKPSNGIVRRVVVKRVLQRVPAGRRWRQSPSFWPAGSPAHPGGSAARRPRVGFKHQMGIKSASGGLGSLLNIVASRRRSRSRSRNRSRTGSSASPAGPARQAAPEDRVVDSAGRHAASRCRRSAPGRRAARRPGRAWHRMPGLKFARKGGPCTTPAPRGRAPGLRSAATAPGRGRTGSSRRCWAACCTHSGRQAVGVVADVAGSNASRNWNGP